MPNRMALLAGWDGVRYDLLSSLDLPHLESIASRGFLVETQIPSVDVARTETAPGWATILTGVWPTKHLVTSNQPQATQVAAYPDVLHRLSEASPPRRTMAATGAAMLAADFGPGPILATDSLSELIFHDRRELADGIVESDERVMDDVVPRLRKDPAALSFVYLGRVDKIGHTYGVGDNYRDGIRQVDAHLGELLDALAARSSYNDEEWLVIVTTDHGHVDDGGHGGNSWQERQSFIAAAGPGIEGAPNRTVSNVDIAPTLLTHFGVEINPEWGLDGRPLQAPKPR